MLISVLMYTYIYVYMYVTLTDYVLLMVNFIEEHSSIEMMRVIINPGDILK